MEKIVVYATTRNMYKYLPMAIGSLLKYNPDVKVLVIAEDDYIDTINDSRITLLNYHRLPQWLDPQGPNYNTCWTYMALIRLFLPKLLKADMILWLDVDTIVLSDLTPLFQEDMTNKCIAAVIEPHLKNQEKELIRPYINTGVLLMNLKLIRELKLDDQMLNIINTQKFWLPDQDVFNIVCKFRIKYLDPKWNFSPSTVRGFPLLKYLNGQPKIIHFTVAKIWDHPYVKLWNLFYQERLGEKK